MNYAQLVIRCPCGEPEQSVRLAVNDQYELLCFWYCHECGKDAVATISLEELTQLASSIGVPVFTDFTDKDLSYLHEMKIGDAEVEE